MDSRFKNLDSELNFEPNKAQMDEFFSNMDDFAMDNAFVEASQKMQYPFAPAYWDNYVLQEGEIIQNVNFSEAAVNYSTAYHPMYWNQAQEALANEGLHYQYKSTYWSEAEKLLLAADRKVFFAKWTTIAGAILFIGLISQVLIGNSKLNSSPEIVRSKSIEATSELSANDQIYPDHNLKKQAVDILSDDLSTDIEKQNHLIIKEHTTEPIQKNTASISRSSKPNLSEESISTSELTITKPVNTITTAGSIAAVNNITPNNIQNRLIYSKAVIPSKTHHYTAEPRSPNSQLSPAEILPTNPEISKIVLTESILIARNFKTINNPELQEIKVIKAPIRNRPQIFAIAQTGIGNTFSSTAGINQRIGLDLGITFTSQKIRGFKWSIMSGVDYQSLNNYTNSHSITNYERSGKVSRMSYGYEFDKLVKWQNTILLGYNFNQKYTVNIGAAIDQYLTSQIKIHEKVKDEIRESQFEWGKNDFINQRDIQLISQFEYQLFNKLSIMVSGEIGLLNQINLLKNPLLESKKNRSIMVGIKYRLF